MEPPEPDITVSDLFSDALDSLPPPPNPEETLTAATPSPELAGNPPESEITSVSSSKSPPPSSLRRRRSRSSSKSSPPTRRIQIAADSNESGLNSSLLSTSNPSTIPVAAKDQQSSTRSAAASVESRIEEPAAATSQSLLVSLAGFVIKAIFFQINVLIKSFGFPIWLLYWSFLLVTDPFGALRRGRDGMTGRFLRVFRVFVEGITPLVGGQGKLAARLAWGCLWAFYVSFVLLGLLVMSFFIGNLLMRRVAEEPLRMTTQLNFDYTKVSPDAFVPLPPNDGVGCGSDSGKGVGIWGRVGWRPVPVNHKLQLVISLTLPESDYNRKLGVFQVRAEFLSAKSRVISSSSQPCLLRFKSSHIRFFESFLKSGTLLAGYFSESQTLRLKMTGFTEGTEPTACIRVILEQRAEYRPGAGIPEIYAASLKLESELPLFKWIIWNWRRTLFIWISMALFVWELCVVLICCRPVIIPRARPSGIPPSR